jgi:glutaredoxin 3
MIMRNSTNAARFSLLALVLILGLGCDCDAFTPSAPTRLASSAPSIQTALQDSSSGTEKASLDGVVDDLKMRYRIFQESQKAGSPFKQSLANVLAGDYNQEAVKAEAMELIQSASLVMFAWENSPSCKKAKEAFETAGANVKIVRLDDPWDKGNPLRAEIGKMVGRTSLPMIFLNGDYIGGYDGGISEEAPGILKMAFQGTLLPKLLAAGAMEDKKNKLAAPAASAGAGEEAGAVLSS